MFPEIKFSAIELKDLLNLSLSLAAFATSLSVAVFNARLSRRQRAEDSRREFSVAVMGVASVREKIDELRAELDSEFDDVKNSGRRSTLMDQRNFYIATALKALATKMVAPSSYEYLILAAALIDTGRTAEAIEFYRKSKESANNAYERVAAQRVYGRAIFLSGELDHGRAEMVDAANEFIALADTMDYDPDIMLGNAAETYRRLINVSFQKGSTLHVLDDISQMKTILAKISAGAQKTYVVSAIAEFQTMIEKASDKDG